MNFIELDKMSYTILNQMNLFSWNVSFQDCCMYYKLNYNAHYVWSHLLDMPSDSILKLAMSSVAAPSSSAPTPRPRGPMAESRRRAWISSEMVSRFRRAVLYSALAWVSLAWRSSTRLFSCCMGEGGQGKAENRSHIFIIKTQIKSTC